MHWQISYLQVTVPRDQNLYWRLQYLKAGKSAVFYFSLSIVFSHSCIQKYFSSVQFSRSVVSDSLGPHESQHTRPPCPSPTPGVHSKTHVHRISDAIQPSHPLSSPSPPAPNPSQHQSFQMSQLITWGGQSTGVSALASFLPKNTQGLISFRMDWLDLLAVQGTLKSLLQHHSKSINSSALSFLHSPTLTSIHDYWKNHSLD